MQSVTLNYCAGEDGILHLDVPVGLINADLEVTVTVQPVTRINVLYAMIIYGLAHNFLVSPCPLKTFSTTQ